MLRKSSLTIVLVAIVMAAYIGQKGRFQSSTLWKIISQQCVPDQIRRNDPAPCIKVDLSQGRDGGYVVFKDRVGQLQYLLMPTARISGIEDSRLLDPSTPDFFYEAWMARSFMIEKYGKPIADQDISVAVNSFYGRSQDQLHFHISCIREKVKARVATLAPSLTSRWSEIPGEMFHHRYFARRINLNELKEQNPFRLLADGIAGAKEEMKDYAVVLVGTSRKNELVLLTTRANFLRLNFASTEELQDHQCRVLQQR